MEKASKISFIDSGFAPVKYRALVSLVALPDMVLMPACIAASVVTPTDPKFRPGDLGHYRPHAGIARGIQTEIALKTALIL